MEYKLKTNLAIHILYFGQNTNTGGNKNTDILEKCKTNQYVWSLFPDKNVSYLSTSHASNNRVTLQHSGKALLLQKWIQQLSQKLA